MHKEYAIGIPNPELIAPKGYTLDAALMARPGKMDIQLDLFLDYANNVKLYDVFHEYFRKWKPPLLAIWGKHDLYFIPAGAEAFRRNNPNVTVHFLDTGHFALETHLEEIAVAIRIYFSEENYNLCPADVCQTTDGVELVRKTCPVDVCDEVISARGDRERQEQEGTEGFQTERLCGECPICTTNMFIGTSLGRF